MSEIYNRVKKEQVKRTSLGKGLSELISGSDDTSQVLTEDEQPTQIRLDQISVGSLQPRTRFDSNSIHSLADSIRSKGIIQPLLVRKDDQGRYELVCGERRFRAAKEAGLTKVPVVIRALEDAQALELALIENLQREDLNPIDEARGYKALADQFGLSSKQIGKALGRDRTTITNTLRLLDLDEKVQTWVSQGKLSEGHARALLVVDAGAKQCQLAQEVIDQRLSVRQIEERIYGPKKIKRVIKETRKTAKVEPNPDIRKIVQDLERHFGTKTHIQTTRKGGKIEIHYYSLDDFERILNILGIVR